MSWSGALVLLYMIDLILEIYMLDIVEVIKQILVHKS